MNTRFILLLFSLWACTSVTAHTNVTNNDSEMQRLRDNYLRALMPSGGKSALLVDLLSALPPEEEISDQAVAELHQRYPLNVPKIEGYIGQLQPNGSWADINYADKNRSGWEPKRHAERVLEMTKLYCSEKAHRPAEVEKAIHSALNFWFTTKPLSLNWWQNQIGVPKTLGEAFLLFEDRMSTEEKKSAIEVMNHAKFGMTGQNKVWLAGNVLIRALLENDFALVKTARDTIASEIVTGQIEGIKDDWSFHQHGPQQQFGNYGLSFISGMSFYSGLFGGTSLAFDDHQLDILASLIEKGFRWTLWNGYMDINALTRQLYHNAPIHKSFGLAFAAANLSNTGSKRATTAFPLILADNYQPHPSGNPFTGHKHFDQSDYTIHRRPHWMASVKMASTRIIGTELVNEDNLKGYYLADGATYFYTRGDEYLNDFPFWDWRKVPGITSYESSAPLPRVGRKAGRNNSDFVGGVTDGEYGLTAMELNRDGLKAHKAWVFTNDFVVCIGAGIQSDSLAAIATSIDQRMKRAQLLYMEGKQWKTVAGKKQDQPTKETRFFHDNTGYILLKGNEAQCVAQTEKRTGQWRDFMQMYRPKQMEREMFSLHLDHGTKPDGATYQYIVLPASDPAQTAGFKTSSIQIIRNDAIAQVVALPHEKAYFIVAYQPVSLKLNPKLPYKVEKAGLYLIRESADGVKSYYEDPLRAR